MSFEPTEELFDNLMKGISTCKESYDDRDSEEDNSECSSETENEIKEIQGEIMNNINLGDSENQSDVINNLNENICSPETVTENVIESDNSKNINSFESVDHNVNLSGEINKSPDCSDHSNNPLNLSDEIEQKDDIVDHSALDSVDSGKKHVDNETGSVKELICVDLDDRINDDKTSSINVNSEALLNPDIPSTVSKPVEIVESIDLMETLSVALDPSTADDYISVETITIDVNQRTQDEDDTMPLCDETSGSSNRLPVDEGNVDSPTNDKVCEAKSTSVPNAPDAETSNISTEVETNYCKTDDCSVISDMSQNHVIIVAPLEKSSNHLPENNQETIDYLKKLKIFSNFTDCDKTVEDRTSETSLDDEEGRKLKCRRYDCRGCDSKFWILRFYYQHISRVTAKILYDCKECKKRMTFTNPCLLKIHTTSHGNSINTIKLGEYNLNVELPSINKFKQKYLLEFKSAAIEKTLGSDLNEEETEFTGLSDKFKCSECHAWVWSLVEHLMFNPNISNNYHCSSCEFIFSSKCALKMHERIHYSEKPYCCPECGMTFVTHNRLLMHLSTECYHLRRCFLTKCFECGAIMQDKKALKKHMMARHCTVIFKCSQCPGMFRFDSGFCSHMRDEHGRKTKVKLADVFFKCDLCSVKGQIFPQKDFDNHMTRHVEDKACGFYGFRCRKCKFLAQNPILFYNHMETTPVCRMNEDITFRKDYPNLIHSFKKRKCEEYSDPIVQKKFRFIYSSQQGINKKEEVLNKKINEPILNRRSKVLESEEDKSAKMTCLLCSKKFSSSAEIRQHIVNYHKCDEHHKYVQVSIHLKEDIKMKSEGKNCDIYKNSYSDTKPGNNSFQIGNPLQTSVKSIKSPLDCPNCNFVAPTKEDFRSHVVEHREESAYQCLECGECFVCKNPLEIHLVFVHAIKDTAGYISSHYVHNSLPKPGEKSLQSNQCSVCFDVFPDDKSLQLHFRSHGMAFLRQNCSKRISS